MTRWLIAAILIGRAHLPVRAAEIEFAVTLDSDIDVLGDSGGEHRARFLLVEGRKVGSAADEADAEGRASDDERRV